MTGENIYIRWEVPNHPSKDFIYMEDQTCLSNTNIRNTNLTQFVFDLKLQHQRVNYICIFKNSELLERLHNLEYGAGSGHGKGHKILKLYIRGPKGQSVCVNYRDRCS